MTPSQNRLLLIRAALNSVKAPTPVAPSAAQISAGFNVAKAAINTMVSQLVPPWALGMVSITDEEIHAVSDAVAAAVINTTGATP